MKQCSGYVLIATKVYLSPTPIFSHPLFVLLHFIVQATPRESLGLAVKAKEILVLAVEAMRLHPELWQHYFDDFLLHKLRLGGLHRGTISHQILHAFFRQMHMQEAVSRVVLLHCYSHVYQLHLAKMAKLLRPLDQIEVSA